MKAVYRSRHLEIVCFAEPSGASSGYLGKVHVTIHHGQISSEAVYDVSRPDETEEQALQRAAEWVRTKYPETN